MDKVGFILKWISLSQLTWSSIIIIIILLWQCKIVFQRVIDEPEMVFSRADLFGRLVSHSLLLFVHYFMACMHNDWDECTCHSSKGQSINTIVPKSVLFMQPSENIIKIYSCSRMKLINKPSVTGHFNICMIYILTAICLYVPCEMTLYNETF